MENRAVYIALGVGIDGHKEVLGLWIANTEGAKFWLGVLTELKTRGVKDVFITCVDGLSGFASAIRTVFPQTQVQRCIVHAVRHSLAYVSWKDRKAVARDLRKIYSESTEKAGAAELEVFGNTWSAQYPTIYKSWKNNWAELSPLFDYPPQIRKAIYTTNAIESLNRGIRKVTKNRGAFPNDAAVMRLLFLALKNMQKKWTMPIHDWPAALNHFAILFEDRFPHSIFSKADKL